MTSATPSARLPLAPEVLRILQQATPEADLLRRYLRFAEALFSDDPHALDAVVAADARLHDLEERGLPPGRAGLQLYRQVLNTAFPDQQAEVLSVQFEGVDIIMPELRVSMTHTGMFLGLPPTHRRATLLVHVKDRFAGDKVVERWDRGDGEDLMRQLTQDEAAQ